MTERAVRVGEGTIGLLLLGRGVEEAKIALKKDKGDVDCVGVMGVVVPVMKFVAKTLVGDGVLVERA